MSSQGGAANLAAGIPGPAGPRGPKLAAIRRLELGQSFQDGGEHYERVRPGYPGDSADWLIPARAQTAADLGAGTGKFTALLVERGLEVAAVDPSADMLKQLRRAYPHVMALEGTAEATGLADSAFDVVSVAQAWHWCEPLAASTEIARILRPHGVLGLIWNQLDTSLPWVHRLSRIMHAGDVHKPGFRPVIGPEFEGLEHHVTAWQDALTPEDIMELTKSRSYYLRANDATREKVLGNLKWYLYDHLGHAPGEAIGLPYVTQTWQAFKIQGPTPL
ncbi:class I SAM-dependent methyltransferase [Paenarthrobacter aurescens]|nr:class I SAM-dependent methyltransferase [Paenarthrobacter aurescens]MDO6144071.1 class I SAM-dependent methyltransferase [Paenarthrobacter aurescens]MDO6147918.1 class I SAM-dependent methyltransferase [Paenarthrobacter aurescens]MDO6159162.1 class I SAM-dependent methyltransferase [Paenarthrobacter aurescens]MDO6163146.1 class I SAM-dependent methyltransferase [Paenarthrobacter aurescens]